MLPQKAGGGNYQEEHLPEDTVPLVTGCGDAATETVRGRQQEQQLISDTVSFMPTDIKVMHTMHHASYAKMIDNRFINYVAIKLRCGVVAMCRTNVLTTCSSVLKSLNEDLAMCLEILPPSVHSLIRRIRVWVNLSYSYGAHDDPRLLKHTTAHHHHEWLIWARDRPDKVNSIEIYDCRDYVHMRMHWNGPGLILHELCHLVHQHCLENGLANLRVLQTYVAAKNHPNAIYDNTLRRDWAGLECEKDLAYAMVDHKEFFAEMSVTYLCDNYPELDEQDKTCMERCSPPCLHPAVVQRLRQRRGSMTVAEAKNKFHEEIPQRKLSHCSSSTVEKEEESCSMKIFHFLLRCCKPKVDVIPPTKMPYCNKFYPFTRGQLKHHDIDTYRVMCELWREIELWDDPLDDRLCGRGFSWRIPFFKYNNFQSDVS